MYFPFQHSNHSKGNAFRHSLWNALIVNDCITFFCSFEKSLNWAEEITSYHEKAFINEGLPKAMDLHNNQIGRFYFSQLYKQYNSKISTKQIVDYILNQSQYTVKLSQIEEIQTSIFMVCLE